MVIRALGWTMLDGGVVIEVALARQTALGIDEAPETWRRFKGTVPEAVWSGGKADLLAWFGQTLLEIAGEGD